jgi:hypothetical protein
MCAQLIASIGLVLDIVGVGLIAWEVLFRKIERPLAPPPGASDSAEVSRDNPTRDFRLWFGEALAEGRRYFWERTILRYAWVGVLMAIGGFVLQLVAVWWPVRVCF